MYQLRYHCREKYNFVQLNICKALRDSADIIHIYITLKHNVVYWKES